VDTPDRNQSGFSVQLAGRLGGYDLIAIVIHRRLRPYEKFNAGYPLPSGYMWART
jgi:hypothetical protein